MRCFSGEDAAIYALGQPTAFQGLPLADCGDGFVWRAADESLCCWLGDLVFEVYERDAWTAVAASEVCHAAATASFERCLAGRPVRVSGRALTTSLVAHSAHWDLEQDVLIGEAFGGERISSGDTRARLSGLREASWDLASVRRVLAVLRSAATGAFVGLGDLTRSAAGATVLFDEQGVSYAPR